MALDKVIGDFRESICSWIREEKEKSSFSFRKPDRFEEKDGSVFAYWFSQKGRIPKGSACIALEIRARQIEVTEDLFSIPFFWFTLFAEDDGFHISQFVSPGHPSASYDISGRRKEGDNHTFPRIITPEAIRKRISQALQAAVAIYS